MVRPAMVREPEEEEPMKRLSMRLAAAIAALAMLVAVSIGMAPASAAGSGLQDEASKAVDLWVAAVTSGDKDAVAAVLAPEFQIVRDNGVAYDRDQYLASDLPKIAAPPPIGELVATGAGDVMVVRYVLTIDATVNGAAMQARAPRLTVFRRVDGAWLVSAHANFAAIGQ